MGASISQLLYDLNVFDGNSWANFFLGLWARIGRIFYTLIIVALGRVADICQLVFKKLAGISPSGVSFGDGNAVTGDIVLSFINSDIVKNVFVSMLILAVILLIITTFAATIKTEFAKDGNNNKRAVINNAFKSLANFVLIPIICIFGLVVGNGLLKAIDGATSLGGATTLSSQIFLAGAYNANRARTSQVSGADGDYTYAEDSFGEKLKTYGNFGVFLDDTSGINKQTAADKIDACFGQNYSIIVGKGVGEISTKMSGSAVISIDAGFADAFIQAEEITTDSNIINYYETGLWYGGACASDLFINAKIIEIANDSVGDDCWVNARGLIHFDEGDVVYCSIYNIGLVYYYYDITLTGFDYLVTTICLIFCAYTLVVTALGLIKRLFMVTTLFIISPLISATYPLDNGKILERWRTEFIKQTLSAYSTVIIINLFLLLLPLFLNMNFFTSYMGDLFPLPIPTGFANYLARVLIILGALVFFKEGSASIAQIIGAGDAMNDGAKNAKAFAGGVRRVAAGAATVAGAGAKVAGGIAKFGEMPSKKKDNSFMEQYDAAHLAVEDAKEAVKKGGVLSAEQKQKLDNAKSFLDKAVIKKDDKGNILYHESRLATEDKAYEDKKQAKYEAGLDKTGKKAFDASRKKDGYYVAMEKELEARRKYAKRHETTENIKQAFSNGLDKIQNVENKVSRPVRGILKGTGDKSLTAARNFGDTIQGLVKGDMSLKDAYENATEGGSRKMREKEKKVKEKTATAEMQKNISSMANNQSSSSSSQDFANREMKDKMERLEKGIDEIKDSLKKKK